MSNSEYTGFGERMKYYRKKQGISQKDLGDFLGVSQQAVAKYENLDEAPKSATIDRIADALGITFYELLLGESDTDYRYIAEAAGLSPDEGILLELYNYLNDDGRQEALKRIEELTEIKKYTE